MHSSGDSRRENADAHLHRCLTFESKMARRSRPRSDDRRFTDTDPEGLAHLGVYTRAGVLTKSSCGNRLAALN